MDEPVDVSVDMSSEDAPGLVGYIQEKQREAEDGRQVHEERWLRAYKNFRGIYDSTTQYTTTEKSKVFIKITKTKVLAAYGQIVDILFANKKFPITVESTPVPEGIAEFAHLQTPLDKNKPTSPYGFEGDGRELPPGGTEAVENLDYLAKYINSPETNFFKKGSNLYNLDVARKLSNKLDHTYLVEGYMDVVGLSKNRN